MDRRSTRRYDLALPITAHMLLPRQLEAVPGTTRDISTRGVYFTTDHELLPGCEVDITYRLPSDVTQSVEVLIRARGKVVRTERKEEDPHKGIGVAAAIEKYQFVRAEPKAA